jgi:hypothetical protein
MGWMGDVDGIEESDGIPGSLVRLVVHFGDLWLLYAWTQCAVVILTPVCGTMLRYMQHYL